jgi:asparagine N-glycosylation enzyme membrane subunit Stt3
MTLNRVRYALLVWLLLTVIARPALGFYHSGNIAYDHIEASVIALIAAFVALLFAWTIPSGSPVQRYILPTIAGLIVLGLFMLTQR